MKHYPQKPKSTSELRKFGAIMALCFGLIGALLWWRERAAAPYLLGVSAFFLAAAALVPGVLRSVERRWLQFGEALSRVMTPFILGLVYFLAITPMALLLKVLRKDLLSLKLDRTRESYWEPMEKDGPSSRPYLPY